MEDINVDDLYKELQVVIILVGIKIVRFFFLRNNYYLDVDVDSDLDFYYSGLL